MIKIGDILRDKTTCTYGTAEYSSFGISVHFWDEDRLGKTLGYPSKEVEEHWEVIDLPKGYRVHEYGGLVKDE
jgi:hypothetical protein